MRTSLNHQPEVHHPKSPAIRWAADYPIFSLLDPVGAVEQHDIHFSVPRASYFVREPNHAEAKVRC
jgi:hypothetical protein